MELETILERFSDLDAGDQQQLMELLRAVQEAFGCVSREAQVRLGEALGVNPIILSVLVKRAPGLREEAAKYQIVVCTGPRCIPKGGMELLKKLEKHLGISPGQTTKDGKFSLATKNCMKQCGTSPNLTVNGKLYSRVTPDDLPEILNGCR